LEDLSANLALWLFCYETGFHWGRFGQAKSPAVNVNNAAPTETEMIGKVLSGRIIFVETIKPKSQLSGDLPSATVPPKGESGIDQAYMEDDEIVKAMARLFAEMGDSYVELIASGSTKSMMIVEALVEVTSHIEFDIASMTFNF
jgi:hypothetical protein